MKHSNLLFATVLAIASTTLSAQTLRVSGNMTDGTRLELEENSVKTYKSLAFTSTVKSFKGLKLAHGENRYSCSYLTLDADSVHLTTWYGATNIRTQAYAHGLTIEHNLQVWMNMGISGLNLRIASNGITFTKQGLPWDGYNGMIYAESAGSELTDCTLAWNCKKYEADIYMFGDSYFGVISKMRWISYMLADGYKDIFIDGYPGEGSKDGVRDLKNALKHGTPKYVFWCEGMNNADTAEGVSQAWLDGYNEVRKICEEKGIELILTTTPTVKGADAKGYRIHSFKNDIVRKSGLRYVDFNKAVGADDKTGEWYPGMLYKDGVHPTETGAVALYQQVLTDFPEVMAAEAQ